jgi:hypothetical protein
MPVADERAWVAGLASNAPRRQTMEESSQDTTTSLAKSVDKDGHSATSVRIPTYDPRPVGVLLAPDSPHSLTPSTADTYAGSGAPAARQGHAHTTHVAWRRNAFHIRGGEHDT